MRWLIALWLSSCAPAPKAAAPVSSRAIAVKLLPGYYGSWRELGSDTASKDPHSGPMMFHVGERLGTFSRLQLSILDGGVTLESAVLFQHVGGARNTVRVDRKLDASSPSAEIPYDNELDVVEVQYSGAVRDTEVQLWGLEGRFPHATDAAPTMVVQTMLRSQEVHASIPIGTKHRTFSQFFLGPDGCVDVRAVTLAFATGESVVVDAPARQPDSYGNWPSWAFELPGNQRQIAAIDVDYRIDASVCDHAELRLSAR